MTDAFNLGKPIGTHTGTDRIGTSETGEHGAGVGVSGGHSSVNASNSQSGGAGLTGHSHEHSSSHPIADKFTSGHSSALGSSGVTGGDAVSGAYSGGRAGDALTGESHAHTTGQGVGVLGENTRSHGSSGLGSGAGAAGAGAAAGAAIGSAAHSHSGSHSHTGTGAHSTGAAHDQSSTGHFLSAAGVGGDGVAGQPAGAKAQTALGSGAGSHSHSTGQSALGSGAVGSGTGTGLSSGQGLTHGQHGSGHHSTGAGVGAGAAGLGAGAAGAGLASGHHDSSKTGTTGSSPLVGQDGATGKYGTTDNDSSRGLPISDPKHLDSGGRHGLVYQESTGKYVHRHELEEAGGQRKL